MQFECSRKEALGYALESGLCINWLAKEQEEWHSACHITETGVVATEGIPKGTVLYTGDSFVSYENRRGDDRCIRLALMALPEQATAKMQTLLHDAFPRKNDSKDTQAWFLQSGARLLLAKRCLHCKPSLPHPRDQPLPQTWRRMPCSSCA